MNSQTTEEHNRVVQHKYVFVISQFTGNALTYLCLHFLAITKHHKTRDNNDATSTKENNNSYHGKLRLATTVVHKFSKNDLLWITEVMANPVVRLPPNP